MILYSLCCSNDHAFEAWFRNSDAFDKQAARGVVVCPTCGDTTIRKAIMAPRISKGAGRARTDVEKPKPAPEAVSAAAQGSHVMAPKMRQMLEELRRQVEANCDYVGESFAEEARKIHYGEAEQRGIYGEAEQRGIYGEATDSEAEALNEEGIEVGRIPWLPRTN